MKANAWIALVASACSLAALGEAPAGDAARGKSSYMKHLCHTCHGTAGHGGDRGSGPRIAPNLMPWEGYVMAVRRPREAMPRYSKEQMSDQELADTYAYLATFKAARKASEIPLLRE